MKRQYLLKYLAILLLFCFCGIAGAQNTSPPASVVLKAGEGITQAMVRVGCNINNFSTVARLNPIPPSRYLTLRIGTSINLKGACEQKPSPEVTALSHRMLYGSKVKPASLHKQVQVQIHKQPAGNSTAANKAVSDTPAANYVTASAASAAPAQNTPSTPITASWKTSLICFIASLPILWAVFKYRGYSVVRKARLVPNDKIVRIGYTKILFPLHGCVMTEQGPDWRFTCPFCSEKNLKAGNCAAHVIGFHADRLNIEEYYEDRSVLPLK